jgi:hypothetical protein
MLMGGNFWMVIDTTKSWNTPCRATCPPLWWRNTNYNCPTKKCFKRGYTNCSRAGARFQGWGRMSNKTTPPTPPVEGNTTVARSSAAEYLTFIAASGQGGVQAMYADENVWLTQKMMGQLYDVETHTINYHLKKVFADSELEAEAVIRNFRITASDGKSYETRHYKPGRHHRGRLQG